MLFSSYQSHTHVLLQSKAQVIQVLFLWYTLKSSQHTCGPEPTELSPEDFTSFTKKESNIIAFASPVACILLHLPIPGWKT